MPKCAPRQFDEEHIFLTLPLHLGRLLRLRLRLDQRLCLLAVLAGAVDASGLLQVGRPGQPRKMFSTSMLDRKALGSEMKARAWHWAKAPSSIVVTKSGTVIDVSEEHSRKAQYPIVVSEAGSVMDVSEEHAQKALSPIVFSESGSVMDVSEEHSAKACFPIVVTEPRSVMDVSEEHL